MYICICIYIHDTYIRICTVSMRRRIVVNKFCGETEERGKDKDGRIYGIKRRRSMVDDRIEGKNRKRKSYVV